MRVGLLGVSGCNQQSVSARSFALFLLHATSTPTYLVMFFRSPLQDELMMSLAEQHCELLCAAPDGSCFFHALRLGGIALSAPQSAMPTRCAMRFELYTPQSQDAKKLLCWRCKNALACSMLRGRTVIYLLQNLLQNLLQRWRDAETLHHPLESWAKRVTWDLDSCCSFASDATVCNADLLAMRVEQCSNH